MVIACLFSMRIPILACIKHIPFHVTHFMFFLKASLQDKNKVSLTFYDVTYANTRDPPAKKTFVSDLNQYK